MNVLQQPLSTVEKAMEIFTEICLDFQNRYPELITQIKHKLDQLIISTIHNNVPGIEARSLTS